MHARVIAMRLQPTMQDDLVRMFRGAIVPTALAVPGLRGIQLLSSLDGSSAKAIELWDTREQLQASTGNSLMGGHLSMLNLLLTDPATIELLEVIELINPEEDPAAVRIVSFELRPGTLEDAFDVYRNAIIPAIENQAGFLGLVVAGDPSTRRGVVATCWSSEGALRAGDLNGYYQEQVSRLVPFFATLPVAEVFRVSSWAVQIDEPAEVSADLPSPRIDDLIP